LRRYNLADDPLHPAKPQWDLDANVNRWRRYEHTGIWTADQRSAGGDGNVGR
jgi:hypothetical protein